MRGVLLSVLIAVGSLGAQERPSGTLSGVVRDATSGLAVPGAVVSLLDSARTVLQRTTSGAGGAYRLVLSRAAVRVQVRRIGFRPYEQLLPPDNGDNRAVDIRAERLPSMIGGLIVTARASCPAHEDTPVAFGLWEQARSALLASVVARESQRADMRRYRFDRVLDDERAANMRVVTDTSVRSQASFAAVLTPAGFVRSGFALDGPVERTYYGPDADVLLSDAFLNGYCMRLADRDPQHPERVGVRFTPARSQRDRVEIDGTLWIDTAARSLTHIAYRYLMTDGRLNAARPGGEVVFAEMPSGAVFIDRWTMRLAGFAVETIPSVIMGTHPGGGVGTTQRLVRVISETGGALAEARWGDGSAWRGTFGAMTVRAEIDSGRAVPERTIRLARSPYRAQTDTASIARFDELVAGPYDAVLEDERLVPIGLELTVPVPRHVVLGETLSVRMPFPTPESFVTGRCKDNRQWKAGDVPQVLMRVVTPLGQPVSNARIEIAWDTTSAGFTVPVRLHTTGTDGLATLCARHTTTVRHIRLTARARDGRYVEQLVTLGDTLAVVPLILRDGDSDWRSNARASRLLPRSDAAASIPVPCGSSAARRPLLGAESKPKGYHLACGALGRRTTDAVRRARLAHARRCVAVQCRERRAAQRDAFFRSGRALSIWRSDFQ